MLPRRRKTPGKKVRLITLKKYLDMDASGRGSAEAGSEGLLPAIMECYRNALLAVGKSAVDGYPTLGIDLERSLVGLERRLAIKPSSESVRWTQKQVEIQLQEWAGRTSGHFKTKTEEVKELLIAVARTAESVGDRNQGYASQFKELTTHLESVAGLEDLAQIRSSLLKDIAQLKNSVDLMTRESKQLVAQLRAEVSTYETKLKAVEHLVFRDELTGVASRHSVEERIRLSIANEQTFCIVMLDLNRFKQINDRHGHLAGDDLLKQFAMELQVNTRSGDLVGRWGGDEFVVLVSCDAVGAKLHIDRIRDWVFGKYTIQCGVTRSSLSVHMDASIGLAEWQVGETMEQVIAKVDAAMYQDKHQSRGKKS